MQKNEEQSQAYLELDHPRQPEAQHLYTKKGLFRFPFSRTVKNFIDLRNINAELRVTNWSFSPYRVKMIMAEMSAWKQNYLPLDLSGLTVLDVGAGEGETAKFFLDHGAAKIICIESSRDAYQQLARNSVAHPKVSAIHKRFSLSDLCLSHDFLKCDIEGYEEELLEVKLSFPAVVEVHGLQLRDKFKRAGWRIANHDNINDCGCTCYAYWLC